jgi:hypothetical protein
MRVIVTPEEVRFAVANFLADRKIQVPPANIVLFVGDPADPTSYSLSDVFATAEVPVK